MEVITIKERKSIFKVLNKVVSENKTWTWSCSVNFTRDSGSTQATLEDNQLQRIFKETNKGLFGVLKNNGEKNKKIKFIKKCAHQRGKDENNKLNQAAGEDNRSIGSTMNIELIDKGNNLTFKDNKLLKYWFPE